MYYVDLLPNAMLVVAPGVSPSVKPDDADDVTIRRWAACAKATKLVACGLYKKANSFQALLGSYRIALLPECESMSLNCVV